MIKFISTKRGVELYWLPNCEAGVKKLFPYFILESCSRPQFQWSSCTTRRRRRRRRTAASFCSELHGFKIRYLSVPVHEAKPPWALRGKHGRLHNCASLDKMRLEELDLKEVTLEDGLFFLLKHFSFLRLIFLQLVSSTLAYQQHSSKKLTN